MIRCKDITDLMEQRIANGEYSLRSIPSERILSEELGVARMTARRALNKLVEKGILIREPNGRLVISSNNGLKPPQIGLLVPSIRSENAGIWQRDAIRTASDLKVNVRPIFYSSWDDLTLRDAIDGLDGLFLIPRADTPPKWMRKRLENHKCPIVVLESDMTDLGLPSIILFPPLFIQQLLNHLYEKGHRSIDCLNAQGINPSIKIRIDEWTYWKNIHNVDGELIDGRPIGMNVPYFARELISKKIKDKSLKSTAIMCTSMPTAQGVVRALWDNNLTPGKDISVCAVDGELMSETSTPSITALERPDTVPYLSMGITWMLSGQEWNGSKLVEVSGVRLFEGESTGPPAPK